VALYFYPSKYGLADDAVAVDVNVFSSADDNIAATAFVGARSSDEFHVLFR
jgi:hypothetical protein